MRHISAVLCFALLLSGCIRSQEMPLAPNVVRIDTQASGILFAGQSTSYTMRRAAEVTLQNGYSHFRLEQAQTSQGTELGGVYTSAQATGYGTATSSRLGNTTYIQGSGNATGSAFSTPIYRPTSSVGVTVVMFKVNEPGAKGAFDAAQILAQAK